MKLVKLGAIAIILIILVSSALLLLYIYGGTGPLWPNPPTVIMDVEELVEYYQINVSQIYHPDTSVNQSIWLDTDSLYFIVSNWWINLGSDDLKHYIKDKPDDVIVSAGSLAESNEIIFNDNIIVGQMDENDSFIFNKNLLTGTEEALLFSVVYKGDVDKDYLHTRYILIDGIVIFGPDY